jgi:glutamine amidotransferase-like uncharacterized protein
VRIVRLLALAAVLFAGACNGHGSGAAGKGDAANILLFNGTGTSSNDVKALEAVLRDSQLAYAKADTAQLNAMSEADLQSYRLLIMPGGNFEVMGNSLSAEASSHIRGAVMAGANYLGVCAGAFFAGNSPYNGLNLTGGVRFPFYAIEAQGVRKSAVSIAIAGGPAQEHYWEDGPQLSGWGDVVARYPDGTPAVVEGEAGKGWMILVGTHPEAPESWRRNLAFRTPAADSHAFAATLIKAALERTPLPHG